ncbi:hypothetical protein SAMN05444005_101823 [Flavobacterium urocaniciphilum]|uniref:Uncharacterized protein n=2 Tax=Flavobacterium urocaniciphilum TaxID=1299341 RepID=A0A1H8ZNW2_9FLAO|nr:hypothetical protein SAMN05444005_101823 [Flavobacterium urocaniciphilum]
MVAMFFYKMIFMRNVYVYDKKKYFYFFLRKRLINDFNLLRINESEMLNFKSTNNNDICIFVLNDVIDAIDFIKFNSLFKDRIIICTEKKYIHEEFNILLKNKSVDISKLKNGFVQDLLFKINKLITY